MRTLPILYDNIRPSKLTVLLAVIQERIRSPGLRRVLARIFTLHKAKNIQGTSIHAENLDTLGYSMFPAFLNAKETTELKAALENMPCFDPWAPQHGEFAHDAAPKGTHVAQIRNAPTLDYLHELACREDLVAVVTRYFRCTPVLDSIQAWWSYPSEESPQEAENFHRDNESIRFLKFFIYLTDVDEGAGPHVMVETSSSSGKLTDLRRLTDEEVEAAFGTHRIKRISGCAGDAFMEDTFGIHKGQPPLNKRRLLVQFRYSVTPTIFRSKVVVQRTASAGQRIKSLVSRSHK